MHLPNPSTLNPAYGTQEATHRWTNDTTCHRQIHATRAGNRERKPAVATDSYVRPSGCWRVGDLVLLPGFRPWWSQQLVPVCWSQYGARRFVHRHQIPLVHWSDKLHVFQTMSGWWWVLVGCHGETKFHAANGTSITHVDSTHLARWWWRWQ